MNNLRDSKIILGLVLVLVALVLAFAAFFIRQSVTPSGRPVDDGTQDYPSTETEELKVDEPDAEPQAPTNTTTEEPQTDTTNSATTTSTSSADINKDMESLDSLDLSGMESDYSEDSLSDL